jgi:hypothetical protein
VQELHNQLAERLTVHLVKVVMHRAVKPAVAAVAATMVADLLHGKAAAEVAVTQHP